MKTAVVLRWVAVSAFALGCSAKAEYLEGQKTVTLNTVKATQSAAERYRIANVKDVVGRGAKAADPCPTVALLREKKEISATAKDVDAWETPLRLTCNDPFKAETIEVIVTSAGPDRKFDTADDISAGPPK